MSPKVGDYIFNTIDGVTRLLGYLIVLVTLLLIVQEYHPLPWGFYLLWTDLYYSFGTYVVLLLIQPVLSRWLPTEDDEHEENAPS